MNLHLFTQSRKQQRERVKSQVFQTLYVFGRSSDVGLLFKSHGINQQIIGPEPKT